MPASNNTLGAIYTLSHAQTSSGYDLALVTSRLDHGLCVELFLKITLNLQLVRNAAVDKVTAVISTLFYKNSIFSKFAPFQAQFKVGLVPI